MENQPTIPSSRPVVERAQPSDIPAIKSMVKAAYSKYIERMGKPPAPMLTDYDNILDSSNTSERVYVLRVSTDTPALGCLVLSLPDPEAGESSVVEINNMAVDPSAQGRGYARVLMGFVEDLARDFNRSALTLYTNVKMVENLAMYPRMGFVETGRRNEDGFDRVFFRKDLV